MSHDWKDSGEPPHGSYPVLTDRRILNAVEALGGDLEKSATYVCANCGQVTDVPYGLTVHQVLDVEESHGLFTEDCDYRMIDSVHRS